MAATHHKKLALSNRQISFKRSGDKSKKEVRGDRAGGTDFIPYPDRPYHNFEA